MESLSVSGGMSHEPVKIVTLSRVEAKRGGAWAKETFRTGLTSGDSRSVSEAD